MNKNLKDQLIARLSKSPVCMGNRAEVLSEKLLSCSDELLPNVAEFAAGSPFSDIWVRDKYCINAVLKIRGGPSSPMDIAAAMLDLDAYAKSEDSEYLIWKVRK